MKVPLWFEQELRTFDPDLRLRWSKRLEVWHLERRVRRSLHPGTIRNDQYHDDYIRAADGYILVGTIHPRMLSREIFDNLRASDLWSNGGWKKVAEDIEAAEDAIENKKWQDWADEMKAKSAEVYEFMSRREGRTVFSAGFPGAA